MGPANPATRASYPLDRRTFLGSLVGGLLAAPLVVEAQQPGKVYRLGALVEEMPTLPPGQGAFYDRMRERGWIYGQNLVTERRAYGDRIDRIPDLAAELMRSGVDVFIVLSGIAAMRVQQVTRTTPIVTSMAADLVQSGLAANLGRPGGNVTGVQALSPELTGKHFSLLKEAIPGLTRSGFLVGEPRLSEAELRSSVYPSIIREAEASAKALGIRLKIASVRRAEEQEFDAAFSVFRAERVQAILVLRSNYISTHRKTIAALALKHRLPAISDLPTFADDGGLASYGFDLSEARRLMIDTIDKILRGAKASDIPIQQVTTFRLVINLTTAKALGLTIPSSLLSRADEVIHP